jgi:hypothetical protein
MVGKLPPGTISASMSARSMRAALAYDCDALVARMRQAVPGIAPKENEGVADSMKEKWGMRSFTLIWHEEPGNEQVSLMCYTKQSDELIAHWIGAKPPERFWQMVGTLGGIVADADPGVVRRAAESSCADALGSVGSKGTIPPTPTGLGEANFDRLHLDCQAWREQGGGIEVTLWRVD